ncbi:MAG: phage tail tape measure protein, partial [Spirochaetes bacterium]|nr:phage tail tape measure protein [Spirochaetota bacterium]
DVLVAAVREGKAEASGFAAAMGSLTPIASNLGVSIDQVAGAMAGITLTGSTAAQAATYLRGIFNVLMKETKQGAVAMDEASQALGTMKTSYADLRKILREQGVMALMAKLNELTEAYDETLVSKVFPNIRAMLGVLSLSGKNMKYNSEIIKEITNSSGSLSKAFAAVADTIKVRYDKAFSTAQVSMISLGKSIAESLIPILEYLVQALDRVAKWFDSLTDAQQKNIVKWALVTAALGPVMLILATLGYTFTFLLNSINGVGKVLVWFSQVVTGTRVSIIAAEAATISWSARIVTLGKTLKTVAAFFATNPLGLAITALSIGIGVMLKKIREVKDEIKEMQDALNFTTPEMEMDSKIGKMVYAQGAGVGKYVSNLKNLSVIELQEVQGMINDRIAMEEEKYNRILQTQKESFANDKFLVEQRKKLYEKEQYLFNWSQNTTENVETRRLAMVELKKEIAEINKIMNDYKQSSSYDKTSAESNLTYYRKLKTEVDKALKTKSALDTIKPVSKGIVPVEKIEKEEAALKKLFDQYVEGIKYIEMMDKVSEKGARFGFDAYTAKLELATQTLEGFVRELSKFGNLDVFSAFGVGTGAVGNSLNAVLEGLIQQMEKYKKLKDDRADQQQLRVLQMEADAFGGLAGKIEVVSYALQAAQRDLKNMFSQKAMNEGYVLDEKEVQKTVQRINSLQASLVDLQNAQELQWLNDMNNVLHNVSTQTDLLSGQTSALQKKLQFLSESGEGSTETFKMLAKQFRDITIAQEAVGILSDSFNELFQGVIDGSKNMGEILQGILRNIINEIISVISKLIALRIVTAALGIGKVENFLGNYGNLLPGIGLHGFAKGGVVPGGYPNDTYPALLSSGEVVLPKGLSDAISTRSDSLDGEVRFEIEGDKLVGILNKYSKRNKLY